MTATIIVDGRFRKGSIATWTVAIAVNVLLGLSQLFDVCGLVSCNALKFRALVTRSFCSPRHYSNLY